MNEAPFSVLGVQTANPLARAPADLEANIRRTAALLRRGLAAHAPFGPPIRLAVLPEFAFQGVPYRSIAEMLANGGGLELPGPVVESMAAIARDFACTIVAGTVIERDPAFPGHLFNTALVVGASGLVARYRKLNPWLPIEPFTSPANLDGAGGQEGQGVCTVDLDEARLGLAVCYDDYFPELWRELAARGVDIVASPSALMHPLHDGGPDDIWRALCRVRCLENGVFGVFVNQGASAAQFPPFGWRGGSYVVDFRGRVLAACEAPGEQFVHATIDPRALSGFRADAAACHHVARLRTAPYPHLRRDSVLDGMRFAADAPVGQERLDAFSRELGSPWREGR